MLADIHLNTAELARLRDRFLARAPDFGSFPDRQGWYWNEERGYKDDFAALCRSTLTPDLFAEARSAEGAERVVKTTQRLLTRKLERWGIPQNLLGWRYSLFLRALTPEQRVVFAAAFGDLLFGGGAAPDRVQWFTEQMWPIWYTPGESKPYALSRNFPTLFLMMLVPQDNIAVRSDMFGAAARPLMGDWLLRYEPFGADDYRRVLDFSRAVREHLEDWAWKPRDMIDVHSFLWISLRKTDDGTSPAASDTKSTAEAAAPPQEER